MISSIFNTFFYNPLYNVLVFLLDKLPWADVGLVIIVFTILIRFILFPLSQKQARTQAKIKKIEPKLSEIRERYKEDKQKQAEETMALYRTEGVNPFSGILFLFIQIPILFALYFIFLRGGLPEIHTELLYSFVDIPKSINMNFLGFIDVSQKNIVLAFLAGATQFLQARFAVPEIKPKKENSSFGEDFARSLTLQTKYVFPILIFFIAYSLSAALSLYWITGNIFMVLQELYVKRSLLKEEENGK